MVQVEPSSLKELKKSPQWVGHKDKVPKNPWTGGNASSINPKTWSDAPRAWRAKQYAGWDGIGFVFTISTGIVGIDLDDCFVIGADGQRRLKPWALDIVQTLDSYTEYSPSHKGVHILVRGEIPFSITKNNVGVEIYNEARYFTVTGEQIGDVSEIQERPKALLAVHTQYKDVGRDDRFNDPFRRLLKGNGHAPSISQMRSMLAVLPVQQDYYDWLRVCMAVHAAYPNDDGIALIEEWSPGYPGEVANKFRSFERTQSEGVGIGTLVYMARQYGWRPVPKMKKVRSVRRVIRMSR